MSAQPSLSSTSSRAPARSAGSAEGASIDARGSARHGAEDRLTATALRAAAVLLLLGAGLGVTLRIAQVEPIEGLRGANAIHAHSHTLYFGWAALSLFALMLARVRAPRRASAIVLSSLAVLGLVTLFVFYFDGYGRVGVAVSASSLVPFTAAVWLFFRSARSARGVDLPYLRLGATFVAISYVGALSRVVLKLQGLNTVVVGGIAVHMFLGAFGAFFVVTILGLTLRETAARPDPILRWVLSFTPLMPIAPLVVVPNIDLTILGPLSRIAAVAMLVPASAWCLYARRLDWVQRSIALAWWLSVIGLALYAIGLIPSLPMQHHAVIAVVHLQTLGVVTTGILWFFERRRARPSSLVPLLHQGAALVMITSLGVAAFGYPSVGLVGAAIGGGATWITQVWAAIRMLSPSPTSDAGEAPATPAIPMDSSVSMREEGRG